MPETSGVSEIVNAELEPIEQFKSIIKYLGENPYILMNISTIDSEFGILSRNVIYRGIVQDEKTGDNITFITERNSRKYKNLMENSKIAVTFLFPKIINAKGIVETWQVRLFDAEAVECNEEQISALWAKEPLFAKIRSHITECGKPVDHADFIQRHDRLLKDYETGITNLERTKTFTVFKVLAKRWDFYMSEDFKIGDRVQYRKNTYDCTAKWQIMHVEP